MKPTLRTIADELQLSTSLVSQVLNDKPGVWASAETRQRVLEAARAVNYRPSASARALVTGRTMQVAVALELQGGTHISGSTHSNGLIEAAGERRYRVVTVPLRDRETGARQIEELVQERVCDGVCLFSSMSDASYLKTLRERQVPTVVIGDLPDELDAQARFAICVDHDNYRIGYDAAAWLLAQGFQRIAWIYSFGEADQPHARDLRRGFEAAVRATGGEPVFVPMPDDKVPEREEESQEHVRKQLESVHDLGVDAVVVRWLPAAVLWQRLLRERTGKAAQPALMALIETNDVWFLRHAGLSENVACLTWDDGAVGRCAADVLINWIEKEKPQAHCMTVAPGAPEWMEKDS